MANVITYGTFDWFHVGHLRLLQRGPGHDLLYPMGMYLENNLYGILSVVRCENGW